MSLRVPLVVFGLLFLPAPAFSQEGKKNDHAAIDKALKWPAKQGRRRPDDAVAEWLKTIGGIEGQTMVRDHNRPGSPIVELDFIGFDLTDADLKRLTGLRELKEINLRYNSKVSDTGLKELARLENLEMLFLPGTAVTDKGLIELAPLKKLRTLGLLSVKVTDAGLKKLPHLKALRYLSLSGTQVTDAGLPALDRFEKLEVLSLCGTKVTDAGLPTLAKLKNLRELNLQLTDVSAAGVERLQKALPKCSITYEVK